MKTAHRRTISHLSLGCTCFVVALHYSAASENQVISKKEFKTLLKTANEPCRAQENCRILPARGCG